MEEELSCALDIQNLAGDVSTFLNGGVNNDVTLSDGVIIPSYRKYVISDLTRTGNNVQARVYFVDDIITYQYETYVCIKDCSISNVISPLNPLEWRKIGNFASIEGTGFDAFLSFDLQKQKVIASANIESVIVNFEDTNLIQVKISKSVSGANKMGVIFTSDVTNIPNEGLFVDNIQNTIDGVGYTAIGSQSNYSRYSTYPFFRLASTMPSAKVVLNNDNNYHIKVVQGYQFYSGRATSYNGDASNPVTYSLANYNYRNPEDSNVFKSVINLMFFVIP